MVVDRRPVLRLLSLCLSVTLICAQTVSNGQIFTNGLAIVNSPAIGTTLHANANLQLSIDVSGSGQLKEAAWSPGSGLATGYDSLNVFLTSAEQKVNFTVSTGPGLLTQEPGSTVKHFNWPIPTCISPGQYEVTLYENSHINRSPFFSITLLPLKIENTNPSGRPCTSGLNDYQPGVQLSSPPPINPWESPTVAYSVPGFLTVSGSTPQSMSPPSTTPRQLAPSETGPLESVTLIVVSVQRVDYTTTISGRPTVQTSYSTSFRTTTAVYSDDPRGIDNSGFLPINEGKPKHSLPGSPFITILWNIILFTLAWVPL